MGLSSCLVVKPVLVIIQHLLLDEIMIIFDGHHLSSTLDIDELIIFAHKIGLKDRWMHISNSGIPHFDIFGSRDIQVLNHGAVPVSSEEFVKTAIKTALSRKQIYEEFYGKEE